MTISIWRANNDS